MKLTTNTLIAAAFAFLSLVAVPQASAQTKVKQITLEADDGDRITGFIHQGAETAKDAPLAILLHGLTGSSLSWLAPDHGSRGDTITRDLVARGYRVVALEARAHGARANDLTPRDRLDRARSGELQPYLSMITQSVDDYDHLIGYIGERFGTPSRVLAVGRSMGAQMAIMLAARRKDVTHLITLVPPAVTGAPDVAPLSHAPQVRADWLLVTATRDEYSTEEDYAALASAAGGRLSRIDVDSGHLLSPEFVQPVLDWIAAIDSIDSH